MSERTCTCGHPQITHDFIGTLARGECNLDGCDCRSFCPSRMTDERLEQLRERGKFHHPHEQSWLRECIAEIDALRAERK